MDKQIKERGITFNAEMVRAVLDGRKTQTRRILSPRQLKMIDTASSIGECYPLDSGLQDANSQSYYREWCPFGKVGGRLYVRETWGVVSHSFDDDGLMTDWIPDRPAKAIHEMPYGRGYYSGHAIYAADGDFTWGDDDGGGDGRSCWHPSIHMPKSASRITLEITDVRVERLHNISREDACAEGIRQGIRRIHPDEDDELIYCNYLTKNLNDASWWFDSPIDSFLSLWESIYGPESWQHGPWVWAISFRRVGAV